MKDRPSHKNHVYLLAAPDGPAKEQALQYVAAQQGSYIMKVVRAKNGADVARFTRTAGKQSGTPQPCRVIYGEDGTFSLTDASK